MAELDPAVDELSSRNPGATVSVVKAMRPSEIALAVKYNMNHPFPPILIELSNGTHAFKPLPYHKDGRYIQ